MIDGYHTSLQLTKSLLKHILKKDVYVQDLEDIDPELSKNLLWILENEVEGLDLDFTFTIKKFGMSKEIELKEDGANILVDESNKKEYVKLIARYKMMDEIKE